MLNHSDTLRFYSNRIRNLQKEMRTHNLDIIIINDDFSLRYFLGLKVISKIHLVIYSENIKTGNRAYFGALIVPNLEYEKAKDELRDIQVEVVISEDRYSINQAVEDLQEKYDFNVDKVGIDYSKITLSEFGNFCPLFSKIAQQSQINKDFGLLDGDSIENIDDYILDMRAIKDDIELEYLKKAAEISDAVMNMAIESVQEGMTENDLAAFIEYNMKKRGSEEKSFDTIVASGKNSWYPHAGATDKEIRKGDIITIDMGAIYKG
ncbi:MAG: M24 family metallopeptidase, partial [Candidatus Lokiarchaeota archaeon]|nr:M24 family metallopeptidase [Candidatus Lokiarchaeota archaeon]